MKVVILGGAGFIGSWTAKALLEAGHEVRLLDSMEQPVHADMIYRGECEFVFGHFEDPYYLSKALKGVNAVIHLAAYQDYLTDWSKFMRVNAAGTALLYELARNLPIDKIVVASSQSVYGEGEYLCPEDLHYHPDPRTEAQLRRGEWDHLCPFCHQRMVPAWTGEDSELYPTSMYGVSKLAQEKTALTLGRLTGIPTVALRYSITQGAGQSPRNAYSGILRSFAQRLLAGQAPIIYEDGLQQRDYVWVGDVAQANLLALTDEHMVGEVYNVGGEVKSVLDYAQLLCEMTNFRDFPIIDGTYRSGDTRHCISDSTRLKKLGWRQTKTIPQIATEYLDWLRPQPQTDFTNAAQQVMRSTGSVRTVAARVVG